jgi:hypothetical protein
MLYQFSTKLNKFQNSFIRPASNAGHHLKINWIL